jgi:hypothetical protein
VRFWGGIRQTTHPSAQVKTPQEICMLSLSANSSFEAYREQWRSKRWPRLTEQLFGVSHFLFRLRTQLRFGELTRAPLKLLRLQIVADVVECDWQARSPDPWEADLPARLGRRHSSLQTLRDAIDVRALLFHAIPDADTVYLRIYRENAAQMREMVVTGCTQRNDNSARAVHSLAMRAKVLGFRFRLEDGILCRMSGDDRSSYAPNFERSMSEANSLR